MNTRLAGMALALLVACGPPAARAPAAESQCSAAYPSGILQTGCNPQFQVAYQLTSAYELKEPALAHEHLPATFTDLLNQAASGSGTSFIVADGTAGNLIVQIYVFQDATQDRYGVDVQVSGQEHLVCTGYGSVPDATAARLFTFELAPYYVDPEKMFEDAAAKIAANVLHGWTCNGAGVAVPNASPTPLPTPTPAPPLDAGAQATCPAPPPATIGTLHAVVCGPQNGATGPVPTEGVTVILNDPQHSSGNPPTTSADANGEASMPVSPGDWEVWFYYADGECRVPVHVSADTPAPSFAIQFDFPDASSKGDTPPTCPVVNGSTK